MYPRIVLEQREEVEKVVCGKRKTETMEREHEAENEMEREKQDNRTVIVEEREKKIDENSW